MITIYGSSTVYVANEITFDRGTPADVLEVLVYHNEDPNVVPTYGDMTPVEWVGPPDPLAEGSKWDVLSKIGPGVPGSTPAVPAGHLTLTPGDWQRWIGVRTADEFDLRAVDTVTVL